MDTLQHGTFTSGGRFVSDLDLNDATHFALVRDTLAIGEAEHNAVFSHTQRRYGGAYQVAETHGNAAFSAEFYVGNGSSSDQAWQKFDLMAAVLESDRPDRYLKWKPEDATRPVYYRIMGSSPYELLYRWVEHKGTKKLRVKASWPIHPLGYGDPMDIQDDFSSNTISDYTFDTGGGTLSVSGGELVPSSTALKELYHSARGYSYADAEVTLKYTLGASTAGIYDAVLRRLDASNFLMGRVTTSGLEIYKRDGGAFTSIGGAATSIGGFAASTTYWLRFRVEGNVLTVEHWTVEPTPGGTAAASKTFTLSGADATKFGQGVTGGAGLRLTPGATTERYDDFEVRPFSYVRTTESGETFDLRSIPGTAPAEVEVDLYSPATLAAPIITWAPALGVENYVWNGDLEDAALGTAGWANTSANVVAGATLARDTTQKKYGAASLKITSASGVANTGGAFTIYRRFKKGVTYSIKVWALESSGAWEAVYNLVTAGGSSEAAVLGGGLTTTGGVFTENSYTFTPTADRDYLQLSFRLPSTTQGILYLDGVRVFEGTVDPSNGRQNEGAGAVAPFGVIEAENRYLGIGGFSTIASNAAASGDFELASSGVATASAVFYIDPSLLHEDEFEDTVTVDVWARVKADNTITGLKGSMTAQTEAGVNTIYPQEGSTAKTLNPSSAGTGRFQLYRLGSFVFPTTERARWALSVQLQATAGSGAWALDALYLFPRRRAATGVTGKASVAQINAGGGFVRLAHDLSARSGASEKTLQRGPGLGGSLLELPAGNAVALVRPATYADPVGSQLNPTQDPTTGQTLKAAFRVWPRYFLMRSG
jgi:hypothetical protein